MIKKRHYRRDFRFSPNRSRQFHRHANHFNQWRSSTIVHPEIWIHMPRQNTIVLRLCKYRSKFRCIPSFFHSFLVPMNTHTADCQNGRLRRASKENGRWQLWLMFIEFGERAAAATIKAERVNAKSTFADFTHLHRNFVMCLWMIWWPHTRTPTVATRHKFYSIRRRGGRSDIRHTSSISKFCARKATFLSFSVSSGYFQWHRRSDFPHGVSQMSTERNAKWAVDKKVLQQKPSI